MSSRLIVKNLPLYVTPASLRAHFEQQGSPNGTVTDVQLAMTPSGVSRRFGFIGYKTPGEAAAIKDWFDKSYIGTTRINVSFVEVIKIPSFHSNEEFIV